MKYRTMLVTLLVFLTPLCVPRPRAAAGTASDQDMAAIRQVLSAYESAWNRHDAPTFSRIFAPDAGFVNVWGGSYPGGRAGIERAHRPQSAGMFKGSRVTTDRVVLRFLRADVAMVDVYWAMTGNTSGRARGLVRGLRSMVLTRGSGHRRITVFHNMELGAPSSENVSPPDAAPAPGQAPQGPARLNVCLAGRRRWVHPINPVRRRHTAPAAPPSFSNHPARNTHESQI